MKMLITGVLGADEKEQEAMRSLGLELTVHQDERVPVDDPGQYEAVVCSGLFRFQDIKEFTALKYIQLCSAGKDAVPEDYITGHGIALFNAEGVYSVPMAEWTVMRAMELLRNGAALYGCQNDKKWIKNRSQQELAGKTALIVGYGAYGMETAKRLQALGMTVNVANRTQKITPYADAFYHLSRLDSLLPAADIVVLALGLTKQTRHIINAERLSLMKPGAMLINASRGAIVDEEALIEALRSGNLGGAALDVFEVEPLPQDSPLWELPNVLLSPHSSFIGEGNHARLMAVTLRNLKAWLK